MGQVFLQSFKTLIPLWLGASMVILLMNWQENKILDPYKILGEGFYYGAIPFALLHIYNKKKMRDQAEAGGGAKSGEEKRSEEPKSEEENP